MRYLLILLPILLAACSSPRSLLEEIQDSGELLVITRNGPTTFFEGPEGPAGIEYELVKLFADSIGVKPRFIVPDTFSEIIPSIAAGKAHIAAAGLTITDERKQKVRFSKPYQTITSQVVYLSGTKKPRKIEDLINKKLAVIAGSSHEERLKKLKQKEPKLKWLSMHNTTFELLLEQVISKKYDYAIGDSDDVAINRRFFPRISIGFDISEAEELAWALPHSHDDSLYKKTNKFFEKIKKSGVLARLLERYYGHMERLNFVDKRSFQLHMKDRLPKYMKYFNEASLQSGYDWKLLAAIGYQESHWNPKAKSPTGVRGIMMLTQATAKHVGIKDRLSPRQSILGGARYLKLVEKKIPERITYPDRIWLTLAGYNIGFGHLEDARILTERNGGNPDKWADVKKYLPLLSKPEIYKTLKYGYARGAEPVDYVDNVRNFYDLLLWQEKHNRSSSKEIFKKIPEAL